MPRAATLPRTLCRDATLWPLCHCCPGATLWQMCHIYTLPRDDVSSLRVLAHSTDYRSNTVSLSSNHSVWCFSIYTRTTGLCTFFALQCFLLLTKRNHCAIWESCSTSLEGETMTKAFKEIAIGTKFSMNGNRYRKVSSRTAYLVEANRVFYIGANERVTPKNPATI